MSKKKIIILAVAAIAVIVAAAVVLAVLLGGTSGGKSTELLTKGRRLLSNGDYNNAVLVLNQAIEENPNDPEAYAALSRAYSALGQNDQAFDVLARGYRLTNDLMLRSYLLELDPNFEARLAEVTNAYAPQETVLPPKGELGAKPVLNVELATFLSTATYDDYKRAYSNVTCTMDGNVCLVRANGLPATLRYFDTSSTVVLNASTGEPHGEFLPNEIVLDDISVLFGGVPQVTKSELRTMEINEIQDRSGTIQFRLFNITIEAACDADGTIHSGAEHKMIPEATVPVFVESYRLYGTILDAETAAPVSGVTIEATNQDSGEMLSTETESDGTYELIFSESGTVRMEISAPGYISEVQEVYITSGSTEQVEDFTISREMEEGQIRLVLTWGSTPRDLDSHLIGTTSSGSQFHVYYGDRVAPDDAANLDVDEMDGYGPETITINDMGGTYEYYVHDYGGTGLISGSGAQVKIYQGSTLVDVVDVPDGLENDWSVCRIENGQITITNTAYVG